MTDEHLQAFLIQADLAGQFLQRRAASQLVDVSGVLDYTRESLELAARILRAIFCQSISYDPAEAVIHTGQYLGETILLVGKGTWAIHGDIIHLQLTSEDRPVTWIDVYEPCVEVARTARRAAPRGDTENPLVRCHDRALRMISASNRSV